MAERQPASPPTHRVYTVIRREGQDDYWLNIGVAFPHEDGKGFNVMLQALPLHGNGKIVLREHEAGAKTEEVCRRHGISSATFYIYGRLPLCK